MSTADPAARQTDALAERGFLFVPADAMRTRLLRAGSLADWAAFAASWDALAPDPYIARHGSDRRRRHAAFLAPATGPIVRAPAQPHYQALDHNRLQGGIERWFEPIDAAIGNGQCLGTILALARDTFRALAPEVAAWHVEVHQFRIEASLDRAGQPTPEGVHRDGVDYVLVLLVARRNVRSGVTTIHAPDRGLLGQFTLTRPCDAALLDDRRVYHGVTAVQPEDPALPACRDVLVVTFRRAPAAF